MDWKEYEREIEGHFRSEYPSARITANAKLVGHFSNTERQIDLLIEEQICDLTFRIAIDAKHHGRKIDVKQVEEFLGLVRDVGVHTGIMIAPEGYTDAAIERAHKDDADVILDVLNFKELQQFHGFGAIPYSGQHGALVQPPFGWVVDGARRPGTLAWLYERGLTFDDATKSHEFMYINFWQKKEPAHDLPSLFKFQESYMYEGSNPASEITFIGGVPRTDVPTAIRISRFKYHPGMAEYTGFVDFDGFIFMCVLFAPDSLAAKNLSKLRFVMRKVLPLKVTYNTRIRPKDLREEAKTAPSHSVPQKKIKAGDYSHDLDEKMK